MENVVIIGASSGGKIVLEAICRSEKKYKVLCFFDSDEKLWDKTINDIPVVGGIESLGKFLKENDVQKVIVAISNIEESTILSISSVCKECEVDLGIIPQFLDIVLDDSVLGQVRDVNISDLLGRHEVVLSNDNVYSHVSNKVILVTGAAGSIGSEVVRQVAKFSPKRIIGLDLNENELYLLELYISRHFPEIEFNSVVCSIQDRSELSRELEGQSIDVVFHCAAHKHVPLMERSPMQAIKNNVYGTLSVAKVASEQAVDLFVLISTDKAVNPTNVMGASKRLAELAVLEMDRLSETRFMAVRFGNVLGSAGSVVPIFQQLLNEGRDLTVTDERITRYFMTIPEAARLVVEAGVSGKGGELFVLDMGEPIKIVSLAEKMIELSRSNSQIKIVGLRPGEKLYEELFYDVDSVRPTSNKKIMLSTVEAEERLDLNLLENELETIVNTKTCCRAFLGRYVKTYSYPTSS